MYKKTCYSHYDPILETTVYARAPGIALTALIPRIFVYYLRYFYCYLCMCGGGGLTRIIVILMDSLLVLRNLESQQYIGGSSSLTWW